MRVLKTSEKLLENTLLCDEKRVAEGLDNAHNCVIEKLKYGSALLNCNKYLHFVAFFAIRI